MRRKGLGWSLLLCLVVGAVWLPPVRDQPEEYQGRTFNQWQNDLNDLSPKVREGAVDAVGSFGPRAVPALVRALKDTVPDIRWKAAKSLKQIGPAAKEAVPALAQALGDPFSRVRSAAAVALWEMGPEAGDAVPALAQALRDHAEVRIPATMALVKIGPAGVPALAEALNDRDSVVRTQAALALKTIGPEAVPELTRILKERDSRVRKQAVVILTVLGPQAIPELMDLLGERDRRVWTHALDALTEKGAAVSTLVQHLKHADVLVRLTVVAIVREIGPEARAVAPELRRLSTADPDADVRRMAIEAVRRIEGTDDEGHARG